MRTLLLGQDQQTGKSVYIRKNAFTTHVHLPGATGKGKTTAILSMLHQFLKDTRNPSCHFVVDFLGGLSSELLLWMASKYCPEDARRRLVYICPSREDVVMGFNPLLFQSKAHAYYRCARATELILRGWESQAIDAMPRLARWLFNSFHAVQQLGLTISDSVHLVLPRSEHHTAMLDALPNELQAEWKELTSSNSGEVLRALDSTRNRLHPFYHFPNLAYTFGSSRNYVDMERFMREKKIVILDLSPQNRISPQIADTYAGLFFNELLTTARSLPPELRQETYCWLDEFQRMVSGPDIQYAIPEVRQLKIRLILAHQSFAQLIQGETDLTSIIFQPQTRLMFGNQGPDADLLAHELASLTFDPLKVKHELYTRRQLVTDHRIIDLCSWSNAESYADQWQKQYGSGWSRGDQYVGGARVSDSRGTQGSESSGRGQSHGTSSTRGAHQVLHPIYDEFMELSSRTFYTFDDQKQDWAREVRKLRVGEAFYHSVEDDILTHVHVAESRPGPLRFGLEKIQKRFPQLLDARDELIENNFANREFFVPPAVIEAERERRLQEVLRPKIQVQLDDSRNVVDPF